MNVSSSFLIYQVGALKGTFTLHMLKLIIYNFLRPAQELQFQAVGKLALNYTQINEGKCWLKVYFDLFTVTLPQPDYRDMLNSLPSLCKLKVQLQTSSSFNLKIYDFM